MRLVLIDTAGPVVGVAAWDEGVCQGAWTERLGAGAEGWLTPALARALATLPTLDAVAVVAGPGAFTGLRVGIAHALGLAFARGVPMISVPTLQLRAAALPGHAHALLLLDARKGRLYAQAFDTRGPVPVPLAPPADLLPAELAVLLLPGAVVAGEGVGAAGAVVEAPGIRKLVLADDAALRAAGALLGTLPLLDAAAVAADYVREPDARPPAGVSVTSP